MASRGIILPALLVAFALVAGGLMEGASGSESFVRRRLAGHESLGASAVVVPATTCPITCGGPFNPLFPNCCQNTVVAGVSPVYFCANNQIDIFNCGTCGKSCVASGYNACCSGTCRNTVSDPNNCGFCGNRCLALEVCRGGLCNYVRRVVLQYATNVARRFSPGQGRIRHADERRIRKSDIASTKLQKGISK